MIIRLYDQRREFVENANTMLLMFDEQNIEVYWKSRIQLTKLRRLVEGSEKWILEKEVIHEEYQATLNVIEFFIEILFKKQVEIDKNKENGSGLLSQYKISDLRSGKIPGNYSSVEMEADRQRR